MSSNTIEVGDTVKVSGFNNQYGQIIEIIDGQFRVLIGSFTIVTNEAQLIQLSQPKAKFWIENNKSVESDLNYSKPDFRIDLHGFTKEQALNKVKESIEGAKQFKAYQIYIVHGKGTGTLRQAVHSLLKQYQTQSKIRKFEIAPTHQGGFGVTIVYLS
jgi:DNA mismatch repair protein MutS2